MFGFQPLAKVPISDDVVDSVPVTLTATGVSGTGQVGSVSVSGVADTPITGLEASAGPHATVTFAVTVANSGSGNKFYIDGSEAPTLSLTRNTTYVFDVSDSSVSGHPLAFEDHSSYPQFCWFYQQYLEQQSLQIVKQEYIHSFEP